MSSPKHRPTLEYPNFKGVIDKRIFLDEGDLDEKFIHHFPVKQELKWHQYIWDRHSRTCLRKSAFNWIQVFVFYVIFYFSLASIIFICMKFMMLNLDGRVPNTQKTFPGLSVQPVSENIGYPTVEFSSSDEDGIGKIVDILSDVVDDYNDYFMATNTEIQSKNTSSIFDVEELFGTCTRKNLYGYKSGQPCVMIKINRALGFQPVTYDLAKLPKDMPHAFQASIANSSSADANSVWVSCAGITEAHDEALGSVKYYARPGVNVELFPSRMPPIAVQFPNLETDRIVTVECRLWAENVEFKKLNPREDMYGSITFDLHMKT